MPDLPRHDGALDALVLERLDQLRQFPKRKPMNRSSAARLDFRGSLFLDGGDNDLKTLRPGGVENQEGEFAVTGDESEFFHSSVVGVQWSVASFFASRFL